MATAHPITLGSHDLLYMVYTNSKTISFLESVSVFLNNVIIPSTDHKHFFYKLLAFLWIDTGLNFPSNELPIK